MDDDFWLDTNANIPYMVDFLDKTGFDIVFGSIGKAEQIKWESFNKLKLEPAEDGFCYNRVPLPSRIPVKGFEHQCHVVQIARNFFMGRTLTAGSVRHGKSSLIPNFGISKSDFRSDFRAAWPPRILPGRARKAAGRLVRPSANETRPRLRKRKRQICRRVQRKKSRRRISRGEKTFQRADSRLLVVQIVCPVHVWALASL